ncbi:response regulator [Olivibacter sp. SDN3]|uniref:response regulator n=1 Tax=Olivibacter sp. SDN3 TaxID=2764720 RepID=UPI001651124F|nr:response regulator [Olivibacter sp. SDN3]QNL49929.1 response regulator [Olivibacter sp. SDN3]
MKNILCVDDDADFAEMITEVLKPEGYQVKVDTGRNMHNILRTEKYGLILLDEQLMWMWGSDLCLELKQNPETKHIPVALVSAADDIAKIKDRCGAEAFVRKPFDISHLVTVVDQLYLFQE